MHRVRNMHRAPSVLLRVRRRGIWRGVTPCLKGRNQSPIEERDEPREPMLFHTSGYSASWYDWLKNAGERTCVQTRMRDTLWLSGTIPFDGLARLATE